MTIYFFSVFVFSEVFALKLVDPFQEIADLQESVRASLDSGLESVEKRVMELVEESSEIKDSAVNLVEEHSVEVVQNFQMYIEALSSNEGNVSVCTEGVEAAIARIRNKGIKKVAKSVDGSVLKLRRIVANVVPVVTKTQNKTLELTKVAEDCARYDDDDCLRSIAERVENLKDVLPSVIRTVMNRLQMQITVLESEIVSDVQKIVNAVVGHYSDVLFNFIQCII